MKGNKRDCNNFWGIICIAILNNCIIKAIVEKEVVELKIQNGFREGQSCTDTVFILRQLVEKRLESFGVCRS